MNMSTANTLSMKRVFPLLMHRHGYRSVKDFADSHGLSYFVVAGIAADRKVPNLDDLGAICKALGIKISELVEMAEAEAIRVLPAVSRGTTGVM